MPILQIFVHNIFPFVAIAFQTSIRQEKLMAIKCRNNYSLNFHTWSSFIVIFVEKSNFYTVIAENSNI